MAQHASKHQICPVPPGPVSDVHNRRRCVLFFRCEQYLAGQTPHTPILLHPLNPLANLLLCQTQQITLQMFCLWELLLPFIGQAAMAVTVRVADAMFVRDSR